MDQIRKTKQSIEKLDLRKKENQTIAVQKVHNLVHVSNCGVCSALRLISSDLYEYFHIPAKERKAIPKFDNLTETDPENSKTVIKKKGNLNPDRPIHDI